MYSSFAADNNLNAENQNLKMQVEVLDLKLENQKLKHSEALKKLEERIGDLKKDNETLIKEKKSTDEEYAAKIKEKEDEIETKNKEIRDLKREEPSGSTKRKLQGTSLFETRKKELAQLSENDQMVLEGIDKFIYRKRAATMFFSTWESWKSWLCNVAEESMVVKCENRIFVRKQPFCDNKGYYVIHFTEIENFPMYNRHSEIVIPVFDEGWRKSNTKCYRLNDMMSGLEDMTELLMTDEIEEPEIGKSFSCQIQKEHFNIQYFKLEKIGFSNERFMMLLFVKGDF